SYRRGTTEPSGGPSTVRAGGGGRAGRFPPLGYGRPHPPEETRHAELRSRASDRGTGCGDIRIRRRRKSVDDAGTGPLPGALCRIRLLPRHLPPRGQEPDTCPEKGTSRGRAHGRVPVTP